MSVTTTTISTNTRRVAYTAGESLGNLIAAIEAALLLMGWELYDASAGTNARAYRAPNLPDKDNASSYKYIVLDFNTSGYLPIKVYESWNPATHAGTNLANLSNDTANAAQRIDLTNGGDMYIFATARYLVLNSVIAAGIGCANGLGFTGVFETERANYNDTAAAGYPPYVWTYGSGFANNNSGGYIMSFCRTRAGATGVAACQYAAAGCTGWRWGAYAKINAIMLFGDSVPDYQNPWSSADMVSAITVGMGGASGQELRGRMFGLHCVGRYGSGTISPCVDDMAVKAGADGWADPNGAITDFWVIGTSQNTGRFLIPK